MNLNPSRSRTPWACATCSRQSRRRRPWMAAAPAIQGLTVADSTLLALLIAEPSTRGAWSFGRMVKAQAVESGLTEDAVKERPRSSSVGDT
jgi:hypothetical protein